METRIIVAYALGALLVLILGAVAARHLANRRQFKVRQAGRGKNKGTTESLPAE